MCTEVELSLLRGCPTSGCKKFLTAGCLGLAVGADRPRGPWAAVPGQPDGDVGLAPSGDLSGPVKWKVRQGPAQCVCPGDVFVAAMCVCCVLQLCKVILLGLLPLPDLTELCRWCLGVRLLGLLSCLLLGFAPCWQL